MSSDIKAFKEALMDTPSSVSVRLDISSEKLNDRSTLSDRFSCVLHRVRKEAFDAGDTIEEAFIIYYVGWEMDNYALRVTTKDGDTMYIHTSHGFIRRSPFREDVLGTVFMPISER